MKKVGVYIRSPQENKENIELRKEKIVNLYKEKGWELFKVYIDNGFSGSSIDRPALQELLKDVKNKKFDILLVDGTYNLSRTTKDILDISKILKDSDITLMSIEFGRQVIEINHDDIILSTNISNAIKEELQNIVAEEKGLIYRKIIAK